MSKNSDPELNSPQVSVIIVGYGDEPTLGKLTNVLTAPDREILVVDNGITGDVDWAPGVRLLNPHQNLGFGRGCNLAVERARGQTLVFINSDALPEGDAVGKIVAAVSERQQALVTGLVVLADEPETVNAAGNPVHYSGLSWAGGWGQSRHEFIESRHVASISGAFFACRADLWQELGGFAPDYFMYGEDTELSLRAWLAGMEVWFTPKAVVTHDYEFSKHGDKLFWLERNRWVTVITLYSSAELLRWAAGIAAVEAGIWVTAAKQGWLTKKLSAVRWVWQHRHRIALRRQQVQTNRDPNGSMSQVLANHLEVPSEAGATPVWVNRLVAPLGPSRKRED